MPKNIFYICALLCGLTACGSEIQNSVYDCNYCWYCEKTNKTGEPCCREDIGVVFEKLDDNTHRAAFPPDIRNGEILILHKEVDKQHFETKFINPDIDPSTIIINGDGSINFGISPDSGGTCKPRK